MNETERLARTIIDAWLIEGRVPKYHRQQKQDLFRKWRPLANAIDDLVRNYPAAAGETLRSMDRDALIRETDRIGVELDNFEDGTTRADLTAADLRKLIREI